MRGMVSADDLIVQDAPAAAARGNIPNRLERLPMTGYQRRIFGIIASAWLVDQVDVALLTFLLGTIVAAFGLTPFQAGLLASMTFGGQLVGNIAAGLAADRHGRRTVFQVTMLVWAWRASWPPGRGAWAC